MRILSVWNETCAYLNSRAEFAILSDRELSIFKREQWCTDGVGSVPMRWETVGDLYKCKVSRDRCPRRRFAAGERRGIPNVSSASLLVCHNSRVLW
jgi:hypothetical protein